MKTIRCDVCNAASEKTRRVDMVMFRVDSYRAADMKICVDLCETHLDIILSEIREVLKRNVPKIEF